MGPHEITDFDFESDLLVAIRGLSHEIELPAGQDLQESLLDHLTFQAKLIEPRRREVSISPILSSQLMGHGKRHVVEHIMNQARSGENINRFQSARILQTGFHDHMLNEWWIYHFHLSLELEPGGVFAKRSDELLFAFVDESRIIFLGIDKHRPGVFADTKWLEILHDHYPEVIERFRDRSISDVLPNPNAAERQELWNRGYTLAFTVVGDAVYHSPGLGRTVSGHSIGVVRQVSAIRRWLHEIGKQFRERASEICASFNLDSCKTRFQLVVVNERPVIRDAHSNTILIVYPQVFDLP